MYFRRFGWMINVNNNYWFLKNMSFRLLVSAIDRVSGCFIRELSSNPAKKKINWCH